MHSLRLLIDLLSLKGYFHYLLYLLLHQIGRIHQLFLNELLLLVLFGRITLDDSASILLSLNQH